MAAHLPLTRPAATLSPGGGEGVSLPWCIRCVISFTTAGEVRSFPTQDDFHSCKLRNSSSVDIHECGRVDKGMTKILQCLGRCPARLRLQECRMGAYRLVRSALEPVGPNHGLAGQFRGFTG